MKVVTPATFVIIEMCIVKENYINPFTDFGFKKIFGSEESKPILIDFLNALLPLKVPITKVDFENTERFPDLEDERKALFDIYCSTEKGEKYIVEMQYVQQANFKERTLYYSTFPIHDQAIKGNWDFSLKAVYCVSILNFQMHSNKRVSEPERFIHYIHLKNDANKVFNDKLTFIYVEMPNFKLAPESLLTRLDKWLYFLKLLERNQMNPQLRTDKMLARAYELAERARLNPEESMYYEARLKSYRDLKNQLDFGKQQSELRIKEAEMMTREAEIKSKEAEIKSKEAEIKSKEAEIKSKEAEIKSKEAETISKQAEIKLKEADIKIEEADLKIGEAEKKLVASEKMNQVAAETIKRANEINLEKERLIQNNEKMIQNMVSILIQQGFTSEQISNITNSTIEQIEYLRNNPL